VILQALYELAQREGLVHDPDYEWKPVRWLITVDSSGNMVGPMRCTDGEDGNPQRFAIPRQPKRTIRVTPYFFCDNVKYVLGTVPGVKTDAEAKRLPLCFQAFHKQVSECARQTSDPGAVAVDAFLRHVEQQGFSALPETLETNDQIAFVFAPDLDRLVTDRPKIRDYWRALRSEGKEAKLGVCLISGQTAPPSGVHPAVKKLPGANPAGCALISFNKPAFWSYGWTEHENAWISRQASEKFSSALNRLLDPAPPDARNPGLTLPRRNLRLTPDTVVCYWASDNDADALLDSFEDLFGANPDKVAEAYRSIWTGNAVPIDAASIFYALTISGAEGRAVVRNWLEASVAEVAAHIAQHFADLRLTPVTQAAKNKPLPPALPLRLLLDSVCPPGDGKPPAPLASDLFESAIKGTPYRVNLLLRGIERTRTEIGNLSSDDGLERYQASRRLDARAALIKAYLNRHKRFHPETTHYQEILPVLDPFNQNPGYLLGQLMAVLERAQQLAMDANATVVDRYFSGASAAPRSVFVRLLKNSQHHLRKADDDKAKAAISFLLKRLIDQIADRFDPKDNGFPARLNTEEQGMFVLGYHQMRRWLWLNAAERSEWEAQFPEAPAAYRWSKSNNA